jgi:hypothetical protein
VSERRWLHLIGLLYVFLALGYSLLMPMWDAPDEQGHYRYALYVARHGEQPRRRDTHEAIQPPLYYWLASVPIRLLDAIDPALVDFYAPPQRRDYRVHDWNAENYRFLFGPLLLRWLNLLPGLATLWLIYAAARRFAAESREVALATTAFAGLTPQFLHNSSSVSNDALANLAGALLFWLLSRAVLEPVKPAERAVGTAAALALPVLCKLTLAPIALAVLLTNAWALRHRAREWGLRQVVAGTLALAALAAAFLTTSLAMEPMASDLWDRLLHVRAGVSDGLGTAVLHFVWSFWGVVGILVLGIHRCVMWTLTALAAAGAVASLRLLRVPGGRPPLLGSPQGWAAVWLTIGLALIVVVKNFLATEATQGRFLFPEIGAFFLVVSAGWFVLLPSRVGRHLHQLVLWPLVAVNLHFWLTDVIPFYYQPFLD